MLEKVEPNSSSVQWPRNAAANVASFEHSTTSGFKSLLASDKRVEFACIIGKVGTAHDPFDFITRGIVFDRRFAMAFRTGPVTSCGAGDILGPRPRPRGYLRRFDFINRHSLLNSKVTSE
jgi:hypothetical protein